MLIEGPIVTLIASFAAAGGVFNIYYVFLLSVLGNVIPDFVYFSLGRFLRKDRVEKLIHRLGLNKKNMLKLEGNLKKHSIKTIIFIKLFPFVPIPGIILAGFLRMPFKRFFTISIIVDFIAILAYIGIGYWAGVVGINIIKYLRLEKYLLPILLIILIIISLLFKSVYTRIIKHIRKIRD